ncbi:hypothetical protein CDL15_Pgr026588 [Punica granatum]|uniref:Uncharacterized protein n=1 Tax=Punica granatum TaxID=22663 RepID=A0A218WLZ7_PUNGR|nr:hypothetical protein CDL15_Pgr026588 [Punica granatum]
MIGSRSVQVGSSLPLPPPMLLPAPSDIEDFAAKIVARAKATDMAVEEKRMIISEDDGKLGEAKPIASGYSAIAELAMVALSQPAEGHGLCLAVISCRFQAPVY